MLGVSVPTDHSSIFPACLFQHFQLLPEDRTLVHGLTTTWRMDTYDARELGDRTVMHERIESEYKGMIVTCDHRRPGGISNMCKNRLRVGVLAHVQECFICDTRIILLFNLGNYYGRIRTQWLAFGTKQVSYQPSVRHTCSRYRYTKQHRSRQNYRLHLRDLQGFLA